MERLKALRKRAGLTQEQLGEMVSVKQNAVAKWELGNGMPRVVTLIKLAQALGCTVDELLGVPQTSDK